MQTLVNPRQPIPLYIRALTGIDDEMVVQSPAFEEIAPQVYELLNNCIFVAHNVNFDYSFIKHHLAQGGYDYTAPRLCTVRLSRKIKPGLPSYSLGKLCNALQIPVSNRHRAGGDAGATAILFHRLLEWDSDGHIPAMLKRTSKEQVLPPNLPKETFARLPACPGVYYFHDKTGKVIYVGKARNIRKRVASHFSGHNPNPQRQHFLFNIYDITTEPCGTELMALLLEAIEIRRLWPTYNRALKRYEPRFALYCYPGQNDYLRLALGRYRKWQQPLHEFSTYAEGINCLHQLVQDFELCSELCRLGPCAIPNNAPRLKHHEIHGSSDAYNLKVTQALEHLQTNLPSLLLIDKGRHEEEQSCIAIEQGRFYGMGYLSRYSDLQDIESIRESLTRYTGNHYMLQLVLACAEKEPWKVRRYLTTSTGSVTL